MEIAAIVMLIIFLYWREEEQEKSELPDSESRT